MRHQTKGKLMELPRLKKRPGIGQILRWIAPEESPLNTTFVRESLRKKHPGELKVNELVECPGEGVGRFKIIITHNGQVVLSEIFEQDRTRNPSWFDPYWFHYDGE